MMKREYLAAGDSGFTLFSSVFLVLLLGIMVSVTLINADMQLRETESRLRAQEAFYVAESGIERAVFELRQNHGWAGGLANVPLLQDPANANSPVLGYYSVQRKNADNFGGWPSVWVRADGRDATQTTQRNILARIILINPLNFLVLTLGDITVTSGSNIDQDLLARDVNFLVDSSLTTNRGITVNADVFYMRNFSGYPQTDVTITGSISISPAITFPGVDLGYYEPLALSGGAHLSGTQTLSGTISRTNLSSANGIVYVDGDLYIEGEVADDMTFVVNGNIYLTGDIGPQPSATVPPQIGLLAKQDVIIPSSAPATLDINAFVLADGGRFVADKTVLKDTLNFTGAIAVRGNDSGLVGIDLNAFSIRNYNFDPNFLNANIPFLPLGANVVSWTEVPATDPF